MTPAPSPQNWHQPCKSILLVDDDPILVEVTEEMLCIMGYQVRIAANGHEALSQYSDHQDTIDLVITDLDMPGMDGRALVSALRANNPSLNIIIMTGNEKELEKPDSPIHAVNHWLAKPFFINDLMTAIKTVL